MTILNVPLRLWYNYTNYSFTDIILKCASVLFTVIIAHSSYYLLKKHRRINAVLLLVDLLINMGIKSINTISLCRLNIGLQEGLLQNIID